jgi:PAS domain S-box-containing protein
LLQEKYEGFELLLNTKMRENWAEGEAALRLAEASLDAAPEPLFRVEQDGRFNFVNVSACRSLGYSREELLSLTLSDINVDIPLAKLTPLWADLREAGTVDAEGRHRRKDGNSFPVALRIRHLELEGAEFAIISARDISAEKEVEQNLAQSEARSRAACRHAGVGFVEWAPGHGGLIWDDDTYRIFGYEPGSNDPTFDLVLEHIVPEDRKAFEKVERRVFEDFDSGYEVEYTIICARGVRHQIREEITVTRDFEASVIYATGFVIDVTKTKQAELDLRESEARLIEAQRMAQMGEWYLDLALGRLTYSDQVYELLGVTREEFQASPKSFEEFVHPEDWEKFRRDIREREGGAGNP